jgi:hypothetical protein
MRERSWLLLLQSENIQEECGDHHTWSGYYEGLYRKYNPYVLLVHGLNLIALVVCFFVKFQHIPESYVFVSPVAKLHWTNHALLLRNHSENRCQLEIPPSATQQLYPDFMPHMLYDFTDKYLVEYDKGGVQFHVIGAMFAFFVLSILFQWTHYQCILANPSMPRVLHYVEYAFSSSLMIMVMAVNMGIVELFAVTGFGAAFFGMNMLGAAAEGLCHFLGFVPQRMQDSFVQLIWLMHSAGWMLFLLALVPIWVQLNIGIHCTDGGTPGFLVAAVTLESVCFFLFGFLQVAALWQKTAHSLPLAQPDTELLFMYDCFHALLSLLAKTFLAWLLMGPAASVITS